MNCFRSARSINASSMVAVRFDVVSTRIFGYLRRLSSWVRTAFTTRRESLGSFAARINSTYIYFIEINFNWTAMVDFQERSRSSKRASNWKLASSSRLASSSKLVFMWCFNAPMVTYPIPSLAHMQLTPLHQLKWSQKIVCAQRPLECYRTISTPICRSPKTTLKIYYGCWFQINVYTHS